MKPTIRTNEWQRGPYMDRVKHHEPAPLIPRWVYALAAILMAFAGLILIGDAILP